MKRSILWKMVLILAAIVSSILCLVVFLNYQLGEEYYISCEEQGVGRLPLHHAGAFYVQEPSASSAVSLISASTARSPGSIPPPGNL